MWQVMHRTGIRRVLPVILAIGVGMVAPVPVSAGSDGSAEAYVDELAQEAIALSRSGSEGQAEQLERLLDRSTDVAVVGKLVLGRNWRAASPEQREEYLKLFRGYVLAGLSRRMGAAEGIEKVDVTGSQPARGQDSMVATRITLGNGQPPSQVDWRVRHTSDGYRIVDVVAEGVSLVLTKRNEFGAIVAKSGLDGLLLQLREWRDHQGGRVPEA